MYVVHSDWLLIHCDACLHSFCDVEKNFGTSELFLRGELIVTNFVGWYSGKESEKVPRRTRGNMGKTR